MSDNVYSREYVLFSTRKPESDQVLRRCGVCGVNASILHYRKHSGSRPVPEETGFCCTACAFNMLLQLANEEAKEWAALTRK